MQREVFLEENRSKLSVNSESNIGVTLTGKQRLLPFDSAAETMSLYELYNMQRDNCEKYRLIFNINPFCTNVLFNSITEPVWREGSDEAKCLNFESAFTTDTNVFPNGTLNTTDKVDKVQAIKDTEYSHPDIGGIVYHCGYDIFNNHLLRTEDFLHAQMANDNSVHENFNTIEDYMVDNEGNVVEERGGRSFRHLGYVKRHMYQYDNCLSLPMAYLTKISEENGWYGFINTGYINIPNGKLNGKEVSVNRVMNNNKPCEFYDMYPDRSLFSFIPKVNKWRKRLEKNWDYCITYPFECDFDRFNELNDTPDIPDSDRRLNALKGLKIDLKYTNNGIKLIRIKTLFDHGLSKGSYVRFYYEGGGTPLTRHYRKIRVQQVGDYEGYDSNRYFSVAYDDVADFIPVKTQQIDSDREIEVVDLPDDFRLFVRQEGNGSEFNYYLRKFKKIKYNDIEPRSEINKTAYEETIYGDRAVQIIYTDDIDVSGLLDNLGRPVSTLYLTIVKSNRGRDEWYLSGNTSGETVEFSHCFGKVTSGLDFGNDVLDYNIRKMHNIDGVDSNTAEMLGWVGLSAMPQTIEDDITINGTYNEEKQEWTDEFYGDVACYDTYNLVEHIIMPIYHRFNTAQRELIGNDKFRDIISDDINSDDFDYGSGETITGTTEDETKEEPIITVSASTQSIPFHGTGNALKSVVTITSLPPLYEGTLSLKTQYPDINMTKTGENQYTVTFSENNTDSGRTVYVYGTLTTLPDTDYNGTFTGTFNIPIRQEEKEFPTGYEIIDINIRDKVISYHGQTTAAVKINKIKYIQIGGVGQDNIKETLIEDVDPDEEGIRITWTAEREQIRIDGDTLEFTDQQGRTVQCVNRNEGKNDIDKVTITASIDGVNGVSSVSVQDIILKGEDETVYTYKLKVVPTAATATTLTRAKYSAYLEKYESGSTTPVGESIQVDDTAIWELIDDPDTVTDYARISQGSVSKIEGVEPEGNVTGKVKCTCIDGNGEELSNEEDIFVTIVPDSDDNITIVFQNSGTTRDTNVSILITQTGSTHSNEDTGKQGASVTIPAGTENVEHTFVFPKEVGETVGYRLQITSCNGDTSSVSYSPLSVNKMNWSQLNEQYLVRSWYSQSQMNNSVLQFDGPTGVYHIDTTEATENFGSFTTSVVNSSNQVVSNSSIDTADYGRKTSNGIFLQDIEDNLVDGQVKVCIGGGIMSEGEARYKNYSIEVVRSNNQVILNTPLENVFDGVNSAFVMVPQEYFINSIWYLTPLKPSYVLEVEPDEAELESNGTQQFRALRTKTENGQTVTEDVTRDNTRWMTSGISSTHASISQTGGFSATNKTTSTIQGYVIARHSIDGGYISDSANITIGPKPPLREITISLEYNAQVEVILPRNSELFGKEVDIEIGIAGTEDKIWFNFTLPRSDGHNVIRATVLGGSFKYQTGNMEAHTIPMYLSYHGHAHGNVNLKSIGTWSNEFYFNGMVSNQDEISFVGQIRAGNSDYTVSISSLFLEFNAETGGLYGAKSMTRAAGDELVFGATAQGTVKEFNRSMLTQKDEGHFEISSTTLNLVDGDGAVFYGNLNPEGYFYNPHTPIKIRQLSDEIYSTDGIVIGFDSGYVTTSSATVDVYNPDSGVIENKDVFILSATSPVNMDFVEGMEFIIYNKENGDGTKVGRLLSYDDKFSGGGCLISLWVNAKDQAEMDELANGLKNKKYMLVLKKEYAPRYAIFQPKLRQFIWREVVPQSELRYDDELYDMTFANGRFYIHTNMNFYCRRQDPQNIYGLQSPETDKYNPLKKFRIGGREKVDTTDIIYSPDNLIDCF